VAGFNFCLKKKNILYYLGWIMDITKMLY